MTAACKYASILLVILGLIPFAGKAQKHPDKKQQLSRLFAPTPKPDYNYYLKNSTNEIEITGALLFIGYKSFFSSQDMASCVFSPSCSVYAIQAFQNDNPIVAWMKVFDRLSRCHPFTKEGEYPLIHQTQLLYDPLH